MAGIDETSDGALNMSAVEIQQVYFEATGGADWELFEKKNRHRLLQKIAVALCGPPTEEGDLEENSNEQTVLKLQGYDRRSEEITMTVFNKILEQEKYSHNGENILISIIRVVCVSPAEDVPFYKIEPRDYWVDLHLKKGKEVTISIFHVFSIRKCVSMKPGVKSCRVYIDHDARVYKNWDSYLKENKLPKAVLIVSEDGQYKGVTQNEPVAYENFIIPAVKLTVLPSPALGIGAKILSAADTTNTVAGIGAMVGAVGVMVVPGVAPVVVGGVLAVGAATSVYGIVRSSINLADRKKHEQDIGLTNSESRASWLNILVSTAGLSLTAASKLIAWAASTGTNLTILINAVKFLKYTTIASGFLGVVNGLGEMIHKYKKYNERPTKLELFQFTSSLLFFGIGVMSNQTAQEIVEDAQAKSINNVRDSLTSNAKRKMFDKITAETRRLKGSIQGNAEVIKGLKTITNKNEFFAKLSKMNKQLNVNKLRISLNSDGTTLINNQHQMSLSKLSELGKLGRDKTFSTFGPAKVTTKNVPTRIYPSCATAPQTASFKSNIQINIRPEELIKIAAFVKMLCESDKSLICELLSELSSDLYNAFLLLCVELLDSLIPNELTLILGTRWKLDVIYSVFDFFESLINRNIDDEEREVSFRLLLKQFIVNGRVKAETLEILREAIMKRISEKQKTSPGSSSDPRMYDGLYEFRNKSSRKYDTIEAGKIIQIGNHEVLIKAGTVDKLQEHLETYSQEDCDLFVQLCFIVARTLSAEEVAVLEVVNFDDDILMRIVSFIIDWNDVEQLLDEFNDNGSFNMKTVVQIKEGVLEWAYIEKKRNHKTCEVCQGIQYCD